ncbi:MAG: UbiA family prenyltransferase, partial [Chloroflexi bacterium]|nr:UbiA family prenyltransferase [Chloroflexota bacterium]
EKDRSHPRKRSRPIASGRLHVTTATLAAAALISIALAFSFVLSISFGGVAAGYLALMLFYTLWLKHIVLLDVFSISAGFVLRAVAGAAVIDAPISPWLYICTGLGALLIALGKRRSEIENAGAAAATQRDSLESYSRKLIDQFIAIVAPSTLLAYTLYTFTAPNLPDNHAMMLTIPFVVYGLFRYLYLVHTRNAGETPEEILLADKPLLASITLWLATAAVILVVVRN